MTSAPVALRRRLVETDRVGVVAGSGDGVSAAAG